MSADSLVMGMATGYGVNQLVPFVLSLRQHHDGPARLFVGPDREVQDFLDLFGISWTEADPSRSALHPSILRLHYCRDALREAPAPYRRVLACDVRDVVFQGDPFADAPDVPLVYFIEATAENPSTLSEFHNQHWIRTAFGDAVFERLRDKPILCSGTIMGSHAGILDYLAAADRMIEEIPPAARAAAGLDQAILNRIAYDGLVPGAVFRENGEVVANLCGMTREVVRWDFDEQRAICRGRKPAVLHQYDRHPALAGIIARRYAKAWERLRAYHQRGSLGAALSAVVEARDDWLSPGSETPAPAADPPPPGVDLLTLHAAPQAADGLPWGPPDLSIFTLATANYAAWAITLLESVRRYEPTAERFLFLLDPLPEGAIDPALATIVPVEALEFPELEAARFAYSPFELANAIKPLAFRWIQRERPANPAIFFDSDICLLAPLTAVRSALEAGAELVLTPHLDSPLDDGKLPRDIDVIRSGVNNMGFICARPSPAVQRFMGWWADRLARDCRVALEEGIFVDQSWATLAQSFVKRTALLRDPGCNLAYWNLPDRPLACRAEGWQAGGRPLAFFHFSGLQVEPPQLSLHQNRLPQTGAGPVGALMESYIARLKANRFDHWSKLPYPYSRYRDGRAIEPGHRLYYQRRLRDRTRTGDPFALPQSFWHEADPEIAQDAPYLITRQMVATWMSRPDLVRHFCLDWAGGRSGLSEWAAEWGNGTAGPVIANRGETADLHHANLALRKEIAGLRASTSWRVTAPLRWLVAGLRRS